MLCIMCGKMVYIAWSTVILSEIENAISRLEMHSSLQHCETKYILTYTDSKLVDNVAMVGGRGGKKRWGGEIGYQDLGMWVEYNKKVWKMLAHDILDTCHVINDSLTARSGFPVHFLKGCDSHSL